MASIIKSCFDFALNCYFTFKNGVREVKNYIHERDGRLHQQATDLQTQRLRAVEQIVGTNTDRVFGTIERIANAGIDQAARAVNSLLDQGAHISRHAIQSGTGLIGAWIIIDRACDRSEETGVCPVVRPATTLAVSLFVISNLLPNVKDYFYSFRASPSTEAAPIAPAVLPDVEKFNCTPLMKAAHKGDLETLRELQRRGEFLEAKDSMGRTALHWAAIGGQQEAIAWLWYFGCSFKVLDDNDFSPIHYIQSEELRNYCRKLKNLKNRFKHEVPLYFFYPIENLVYKGGGPKGIAYVGAHEYLEAHQLLSGLKRVAGTSAGAINAALVGLGYTAQEIRQILNDTNLIDFLDHEYVAEQQVLSRFTPFLGNWSDITLGNVVGAVEAVHGWRNQDLDTERSLLKASLEAYQRAGVCKGEKFLQWIEQRIYAKTRIPNCTFGEFRKKIQESKEFKHIYFYATQITPTQEIVCLNSEESSWDHVVIADAIRASMSIPFVFEPYVLRLKTGYGQLEKDPQGRKFLDGGMIKNLPIDRFDLKRYRSTNSRTSNKVCTNYQTLAFNLIDPPPSRPRSSRAVTMPDVARASGEVFVNGEDILMASNLKHTVRMININNLGVGLLSGFFATQQTKNQLIASGWAATHIFFTKQQALALQHKEHSPFEILATLPQPLFREMPLRAPIQIEEVADEKSAADTHPFSFEDEKHAEPSDSQTSIAASPATASQSSDKSTEAEKNPRGFIVEKQLIQQVITKKLAQKNKVLY